MSVLGSTNEPTAVVRNEERGERRWEIEVSTESTRLRIPHSVQAFRVSAEDNVLLSKTRKILKSLEKRHAGHKVKITELELINHLLSLLDVNGKCPFLIAKPCGSYGVDGTYYLSDGIVKQTEIGLYLKPFLEANSQLAALVAFSRNNHFRSQFQQVLQEFVLDFLSRHTQAVRELYINDKLNLRTLLYLIRDELLSISVVYNCLSTVITTEIWNCETVDCFLRRFITTTIYTELRLYPVKEVIGRLQHAVLGIFERYFNCLFNTGKIDPVLENDFIFQSKNKNRINKEVEISFCDYECYSVENDMGVQAKRTHSSFWTKLLIRYAENGALNACRLRAGSRDYEVPNKFSIHLRKALQMEDRCSFIPTYKILRCVEHACMMCAKNNSAILFSFIMENNELAEVLKQIESIYTGFAVREMAFDLFGATRISQHCSLILSFQNSLKLSGFSSDVCGKWIVRCESGFLDDLVIKPQLSWPICFVVEDALLSTLNMCLRFLLKLLQAQEALSAVRIDRSEPLVVNWQGFSVAATKEININRQRLNHLICFVEQPLAAISEIFFTHLQAMLTKKFTLVVASETLEEAQCVLRELNGQLANLVTRSGSRGLVHDAITKLCDRATEVGLRWRMDSVSLHDIDKMLKAVKREKDLLIGLGRSMHGTIFTLLQPLLT